MKRADWVFIGVAAAVALAVWWFFIRPKPGTKLNPGTTNTLSSQSKLIGSNLPADASNNTGTGAVIGIWGIDWF